MVYLKSCRVTVLTSDMKKWVEIIHCYSKRFCSQFTKHYCHNFFAGILFWKENKINLAIWTVNWSVFSFNNSGNVRCYDDGFRKCRTHINMKIMLFHHHCVFIIASCHIISFMYYCVVPCFCWWHYCVDAVTLHNTTVNHVCIQNGMNVWRKLRQSENDADQLLFPSKAHRKLERLLFCI